MAGKRRQAIRSAPPESLETGRSGLEDAPLVGLRKIKGVHLLPTTRGILKESDGCAPCLNWLRHEKPMFQLDSGAVRILCTPVCNC